MVCRVGDVMCYVWTTDVSRVLHNAIAAGVCVHVSNVV